jgi:uncharacterized membrane protein
MTLFIIRMNQTSCLLAICILLLLIMASSLLSIKALGVNKKNNVYNDIKIGCNTLGYIVVLKDNISADPKAISQEYESKGAMVTHIYESALKGFAIKISGNLCHTILSDLRNDSRISHFEPDNKVSIQ